MPRKAPKEVIEHRITFGDYERKQLEQIIDAYQKDKVAENIPNYMLGVASLGIAATVGVVGYALYYWLDSVPDIKDLYNDLVNNVFEDADSVATKIGKVSFSITDQVLIETPRTELQAEYDKAIARIDKAMNKARENAPSQSTAKRIFYQKMLVYELDAKKSVTTAFNNLLARRNALLAQLKTDDPDAYAQLISNPNWN